MNNLPTYSNDTPKNFQKNDQIMGNKIGNSDDGESFNKIIFLSKTNGIAYYIQIV